MYILQKPPTIHWDAATAPRALVLMMDIDAGGRSSLNGSQPGSEGPWVHALWSECTGGSLAHCRSLIKYSPPDVRQGTNRIVFLALRQPSATWVQKVAMRPFRLSLGEFLRANYPDSATRGNPGVAYSFLYLSGSEEESELEPRRYPPWNAPPPPAPARPPWREPTRPSPPPSPKPPAYTWWGGTESKRPWEHRRR